MNVVTHIPPKEQTNNVFDEKFIWAINVGKNTVNKLSEKTQNKIYVGGFTEIFDRITGQFNNDPIDVNFNQANSNLLIASEGQKKFIVLPNNVKVNINDIIAKNVIPYNNLMKQRLINAAETDQAIQTAFNILTGYVLDEERKTLLKPIDSYKTQTETEFKKILNNIVDKEIQKMLGEFIASTDRYSRVWEEFVPLSFKRALNLGTSGFFTELINLEPVINDDLDINVPLGTPAICKDLHPYYFQKVFYNRKTLKPVFLEYSDKNYKLIDDTTILSSHEKLQLTDKVPDEQNIKTEDVLKTDRKKSDYAYVEKLKGYKQFILRDPNERKEIDHEGRQTNLLLPINQCVIFRHGLSVAPNVEFFGVSKIFSVLPISELNREIHYEILPSVNKLQMKGAAIITAENIRSKSKLEDLEKQLEEGANFIITASPIGYQSINIPVDMVAISSQRFDNIRHILMGINLPSPMLNFENVTNRDTLRIVAEFFKDTSLNPLRQMVNQAMRDQWYYRLVEFFFRHILPNSSIASKADKKNYDFINLKLQIVTEFGKINFAVFEELVKALNQCLFLTEAEKREEIGRAPNTHSDERVDSNEKDIGEVDKISKAVRDGQLDPLTGKRLVSKIRSDDPKTGTSTGGQGVPN